MTLTEACISAREGNFVSHKCFDSKQSMHDYKGNLYYEDGANLTGGDGLEYISKEEWAKDGWYIKYPADRVDQAKLKELHEKHKTMMLSGGYSYEECIIPTKVDDDVQLEQPVIFSAVISHDYCDGFCDRSDPMKTIYTQANSYKEAREKLKVKFEEYKVGREGYNFVLNEVNKDDRDPLTILLSI